MKKLLLGSAVLAVVATAGTAMAADMAVKAPVYKAPPPVVAYSWTGFYIGAHVGGAWASQDHTLVADGIWAFSPVIPAFSAAGGSPSLKPSGFAGGGQIGYNYQAGNWVWGLEGDATWMNLRASRNSGVVLDPNGIPTVFAESSRADWLLTLRPRLGVAVGNTLLYATGGLAVGHVQATSGVFRPLSGYNSFGSASTTKTGWTVGGGLEYMFASNWSVKAEYLYVDLGTVSFRTTDLSGVFPTFFESAFMKTKLNVATVGLNYKFGGPVVANY